MRQLIQWALLGVIGLSLAGCGHRPLYGNSGTSASAVQHLSGVSVEEQGTRAGQLVRNELISSLGSAGGDRYLLKISVVEKTDNTSSIPNSTVDRFRYRLNVSYQLLKTGSGQEMTSGKSFSTASYDTVQEPVADLQAKENARERAAREVAQDLRLRLSAFFASSGG